MAATYKYLTATAQIKTSAAKLKGFFVADGTTTTVAIYDTPDATTTGTNVIATTAAFASAPSSVSFTGDEGGVNLSKGLYVVLAGTNPKVTIFYE